MDDFRIPATPLMAQGERDPFDPYDGADSVDITGLGVSESYKSAHLYGRELETDTTSTVSAAQSRGKKSTPNRHQMPAPPRQQSDSLLGPDKNDKGPSRITYFSALTQRHDHPGRSIQIYPPTSTSKTYQRRSGEGVLRPRYSSPSGRPSSQHWDNETPARASQHSSASQPGVGDSGYRGIQDAIAVKFQELEKQIDTQEHQITDLKFSLNDAKVANKTHETEKRQLKQKVEDLERSVKKTASKVSKHEVDSQKYQDCLKRATEEKKRLQADIEKSEEKAKKDAKALADSRKTIKEMESRLESTLKEQQGIMRTTASQNRQAMDAANEKIATLETRLQMREAELGAQREANTHLAKKIEDIPERNFQAMSTCTKKIFEKLDDSKTEILTSEKSARQHSQEQHGIMVQCLNGLLTSSQNNLEMLVSSRTESKKLVEQVLSTIQESVLERKKDDSGFQSELQGLLGTLKDQMHGQQGSIIDAISKKCRESDVLAGVCEKQETMSKALSEKFNEQLKLYQQQVHHVQGIYSSLKQLEEAPKEDPVMVANMQSLRDQKTRLESDIKDRDLQIGRLERACKEQTGSIIAATGGFVEEIRQLSSSFREREVEYRRALDQASNLANQDAKRELDKAREEAQKELQSERAKRQALEKDLRQSKEDLSVLEDSHKRAQQCQEAVQKELNSVKLGNQVITEHLEERARALDAQIGRDAAVIAKLKAALSDKEMDYANLQSSMEAYDEKVHVLVEHLTGWAQDYNHVSAIRSRLEMLGQIDRSCAATARIREAEQIDSVLALLRQYNARKNGQDEQEQSVPFFHTSDSKGHDQQMPDLHAYMDGEAKGSKTTKHPASSSFRTPANANRKHSSSIKPPPVHNDRTFDVTLEPEGSIAQSSPDINSSPIPPRARKGRRGPSVATSHADSHATGSPVRNRATISAGRKRTSAKVGGRDPIIPDPEPEPKRRHLQKSAYFLDDKPGRSDVQANNDDSDGVSDDISTSPPSFIKIEDA